MRSAVVGAAAVMTGQVVSARSRTLKAFAESLPDQGAAPPLSNDLAVVKKGKGPVLTTIDEFYKCGERVEHLSSQLGRGKGSPAFFY